MTDNLLPETAEAGELRTWAWRDGTVTHAMCEVGDILWVRETWQLLNPYSDREYYYKATECGITDIRWFPSIHMPKEAARIFLRVTDFRAERVQDITGRDVVKEGITMFPADSKTDERFYFKELWNSLNAKPKPVMKRGKIVGYISYPWENIRETREYRGKPWEVIGNPWVYAYTFERADKPEGWPLCA